MDHKITHRSYGHTPDGLEVSEYTMINRQGLVMKVINLGCTITALHVPDRNGQLGDVVLGYDSLEGYLQSTEYIGCIVGRFANRIAFGKFTLDGKEYSLATNLPPHHLHGGNKGFSHVVWAADEIVYDNGVGIRFQYLSADGDEGFPGNLRLEVIYRLDNDNKVSFEYKATTDQPTIINLTQHSYFNLNGGQENVLDHELTIHADEFLPTDELMIPTGEKNSVVDTPFDFRNPKTIGKDIQQPDKHLVAGNGYDHTYVLRPSAEELHRAATLFEKNSGRKMEVYTTEPGIQVYSSNFLKSKMNGKGNIPLIPRLAICLETQHYPDSPNRPSFPTVVRRPGEEYHSKTVLAFSVE